MNPALYIFEQLHKKLRPKYSLEISVFHSYVLRENHWEVVVKDKLDNIQLISSFRENAWGSMKECALDICRFTKNNRLSKEMVEKFFSFKPSFCYNSGEDV